jgi:hypothetical protein
MSQVERRLREVSSRLRRAREELAVLVEQLAALEDAADEARIRALVSETPADKKEEREARRHADTLARSRDTLNGEIERLRTLQDDLLDRLVVEGPPNR